ncbi:MAG TPA: hypothetical protein VI457_09520 [Methylococcaceae bacterium]|nr:hypothetical protein [Methylococcaceae bacterium]
MIFRLLLTLCLAYPVMGWAETGKRYFRWVDEKGDVHYTEYLPPEQASRGGKKINEKGMTVETLAGAKTAEQREQEGRLKRLHAGLVRVIREQAERDEGLMRTFRSVEDIQQTLQGKLTTLDSLMRVVQTNRERQTAQLDVQQKKAAGLERNGKLVPEKLKEEIEASRKLIADYELKLLQHQEQKRLFQAEAEVETTRLSALLEPQGKNSLNALVLRLNDLSIPPGNPADLLVAAIPCQDGAACAAAWKKARTFVELQTPHPRTVTDTVLFSADPTPDQPLGMVVAYLRDGKDSILFMEVLCEHSPTEAGACAGPDAQGLREGFRMTLLNEIR